MRRTSNKALAVTVPDLMVVLPCQFFLYFFGRLVSGTAAYPEAPSNLPVSLWAHRPDAVTTVSNFSHVPANKLSLTKLGRGSSGVKYVIAHLFQTWRCPIHCWNAKEAIMGLVMDGDLCCLCLRDIEQRSRLGRGCGWRVCVSRGGGAGWGSGAVFNPLPVALWRWHAL